MLLEVEVSDFCRDPAVGVFGRSANHFCQKGSRTAKALNWKFGIDHRPNKNRDLSHHGPSCSCLGLVVAVVLEPALYHPYPALSHKKT